MSVLGPSACRGRPADKKLSQPVVDGGFLVRCQYLSLYGAVYDGRQGGTVQRSGDSGANFEMQRPKQIKALGRKVRRFDQKVWDKFKYAIVLNGNWCKFSQNRNLREFLLSTGDSVLAEASPYDNIWGIRLSANSLEAQDPMKWRGQNLLGFALMEIRDELRRVTQNEMLCDWNAV